MLLISILLALTTTIQDAKPKEVRAQFVELAAKKDHDGCLALWTKNPEAVLSTIDADLEGSLKARERSSEPNMNAILTMHQRALWGAQIAFEASGDPLILDYASAFVGWDEPQRKKFREGQAAFRAAMHSLETGDAKSAFASGKQCLECASPLGDWWGTAMGYDALAASHKALGEYDHALEAASRARAIYHGLGLTGDEYAAAATMADVCVHMKLAARGKAAFQLAIALAKKIGDADGEKNLTAQQTALENMTRASGK